MKDFFRKHVFLIAGVAFSAVLILSVIVIRQIGLAYGKGLKGYENPASSKQVSLIKTTKIKHISVKKSDSPECIEITPDGAVRLYKTCGGTLEEAYRSTETKSIDRLFRFLGEKRYADAMTPGATQIKIEMEDGSSVTIYIPANNGNGSPESEIITIIDEILDEKPEPTPTPSLVPVTPTPTIYAGGTPVPTPTVNPYATPTPTQIPQAEKPFTCDFYDAASGGVKPYRVSNVVCSTEPIPQR